MARPLVPLAFCYLLLLLLTDRFSFFPFNQPPEGILRLYQSSDKIDSRLVLLSSPENKNSTYQVTARLETQDGVFPGRVLLKYPSSREGSAFNWRRGDHLRCFVKWKAPFRYKNPGTPDYRKTLARQGIFLTATLFEEDECMLISRPKVEGFIFFLLSALDRLRKKAFDILEGRLTPSSFVFIKALTLGDRSGFGEEDWELFRKTGTTHLVAVSGLQLAWIGGVFYLVILTLLKRSEKFLLLHSAKTWALLFALVPMAIFVVLAGGGPSIVRAWIMTFIGAAAFAWGRDRDEVSTIAFAFLALTLASPGSVFSISLQLSFLAVIGLSAGASVAEKMSGRLGEKTKMKVFCVKTAVVSLAISLATAPAVIFHFHSLSLSGLVNNLWAIPYTNGLLLLSFLMMGLEGISPFFASKILWKCLDFLTQGFLKTLKIASEFSLQIDFYPDAFEFFYLMGGVAWLFSWFLWPRARRALMVVLLGGALLCAGAAFLRAPTYEVCFIDVGQGDAALVRSPGGKSVLIDTGGFLIPFSIQKNPQKAFDIGESVLVPYLKTKGVKFLDRLILSHPHPDHFGGARGILESIPVGALCGNGQTFPDESYDRLLETQNRRSVPACVLRKGDVWEWEGLRWDVVYPSQARPSFTMNDNSLVIRVSDSRHSFLFTGDIEKVGEAILADQPGIESEVVKIPHHASKTSSSVAFIDRVKPRYAVASLGENNFFGFPHPDILEKYERRGAQVFRTDQDGEICFSWKATSSPESPSSTLSTRTFSSGR